MSTSRVIIAAVVILSSIAATSAYNITVILEKYPEFTKFNSILTSTGVAEIINRRKVITVLALNNDRIGDLAERQEDALKRIISTHVVLDYFDVLKLKKLKDTKTQLTTLYQSSGTADDQQGFLDVVHHANGTIVFGSAMKGAPIDSQLMASVITQPFYISVLSISKPIIAPGIDGSMRPGAVTPVQAPAPKAAEAPAPKASEAPEASAPETAVEAPDDAPADAPTVEAPSDAPTSAPAPAPEPKAADATPADVTPPPSTASRQMVSGVAVGIVVALASFI